LEQLSIMNKVNEVALELSTMSKVNEVALSAANEVDVNEVDVNEADTNEVNVNEVNTNEVNVDEVKSDVNAEAKVEVNEKSEEVVMAKPPEVPQRFDFAPKVQVEEFGMEEVKKLEDDEEVEKRLPLSNEVMQNDDMKVKEESRHVSWDPGELVNAKAHMEMFNVKVEMMQRGDVTTKALFDATALYNFVRLYTSEVLVLVARNAARFVDVNPLSSRSFAESFLPILSDYG